MEMSRRGLVRARMAINITNVSEPLHYPLFFSGGYSKEKVIIYYDKLMEILDRLETRIIFLYSKDVRATLEKAFEVRGENWKPLILDPGDAEYFQIHGYDHLLLQGVVLDSAYVIGLVDGLSVDNCKPMPNEV